MNYLRIYNNIIDNRKNNVLPETEYGENHHIIPKCMGGNDSEENIVRLSAKEHYIAHHLLYKHYKTSKLAHAWFMMTVASGNQQRYITAVMYENAKRANSNALSETMMGKGNHFFGKTHNEESRKKISDGNKKFYSEHGKSQEVIDNWVKLVASKPKSKEHREKIGRKGLVLLQNIDTMEIIRVPYTDNRNFSKDWVNPRKLKPEKVYKCEYCEMITTPSNLKRWHNDNCKRKLNNEN
jgi:hypothetical protein